MPRPPASNQTFTSQDELNELRKELEDKIKDAVNGLRWFIGFFIVILLSVFGFFAFQLNQHTENIDDLKRRIIVIETKLDLPTEFK